VTLVAEIRRIDYGNQHKLRVDLFQNGADATAGALVHTAGRVEATDTEEAHVRAALEVLGIQERATVAT
jgi:hypothetical protein